MQSTPSAFANLHPDGVLGLAHQYDQLPHKPNVQFHHI